MTRPEVGSVVSHYRLARHLGAGGMGDVYLARDLQLDRDVAIKFLNLPDDAHARRRLLREAKAVAALDHPSICAIYDVGSDPAGGDFIVMQYVEGETLASRLRRGRLDQSSALRLAAEIAHALASAHARGIIHRDLKPHNIVLAPGGAPKLLDFGIAKRLLSDDAVDDETTASALTHPDAAIGTPAFMAPEQIEGQPVDARSDLFALGCVLYECLTGRRAFEGATRVAIFAEVLHVEPPPPSSIVPGLTAAHDALCARLLAKAPGERFQSAEEVVAAIGGIDSGARFDSPDLARRGGFSSRSRLSFAARPEYAVVLVAITMALAVAAWQRFGSHTLAPAPPEAARWYDRGVEALREGSYGSARASLEEAIRLHPDYVLAHARLADALAELDDQNTAQQVLVKVSALLPDESRLPEDERLRLSAVRATVLREPERALSLYAELRDRKPDDAQRWLDVGRAHEALGQRGAAAEAYQRVVDIDPQNAPGHLRLGVVLSQGGRRVESQRAFDEAIRLYRTASNVEGEAESHLRKATALTDVRDFILADEALGQVESIAPEATYPSIRIRAGFEKARLALFRGEFSEAESIARQAVDKAAVSDLDGLAAAGLIDMANALMGARQYAAADDTLVRAIALAESRGTRRTEMRARLQQAALRLRTSQPGEALALSNGPLEFYATGRYVRNEADVKLIRSQALENLERYDDAATLTEDVLRLAESMGDDGLTAGALENLAGQLTKTGRLPEALKQRERIETIHRAGKDVQALPYDLTNRGEILIQLGRGAEAETALDEVSRGIADGLEAYAGRTRRVALLRALRAATEERFAEVAAFAREAGPPAGAAPDGTAMLAAALVERARAARGETGQPAAEIAQWPSRVASPTSRRELAYWVGLTLVARGEHAQAWKVVETALADPNSGVNLELRWRLAAVAAIASSGARAATRDGRNPGDPRRDLDALLAAWPDDAATYTARPDVTSLRRKVS